MNSLIILFAVIAVIGIGFVIVLTILDRKRNGTVTSKGKRSRGQEAILKEANRRLARDPRDPAALASLGDVYFKEEDWPNAYKAYELLVELTATTPNLDKFDIYRRCGLTAANLDKKDVAYKCFAMAFSIRRDNFEVNYNLGVLEFHKKSYERAIKLLDFARKQNPDNAPVLRFLGHALFKIGRHREALEFIRKSLELAPDDKETMYVMGECYSELGQTEQALKVFTRLRPDPVIGPKACLFAGTIHTNHRQVDQAIEDFQIGLRHKDVKPDVLVELRYRLCMVYIKQNDIPKAIPLLAAIQESKPNYKDVPSLLTKYQELSGNRNLQIYTLGSSADFVALCRKIVVCYFARAKVKITNISLEKADWADLLAEIDTPRWSDVIMFRFMRTQGTIGELVVRDFHSHIKEVKAGKGICLTLGKFGEEARHYTEARLIDLIEKDRLMAILQKVDAKVAALAAAKGRAK